MSLLKRQRELDNLFKNFDRNGFSAKDLEDLCSEKHLDMGNAEWIHWSAEIYSFGKWIRKYGYYPSWLPLMIMTDHSPCFYATDGPVGRTYVETTDVRVMFYHSKENAEIAKREFGDLNKHIYTMYSPIGFCKKYLNLHQNPNAKGTLAFLHHTLPESNDESDKKELIKQLLALPAYMHPIAICIHSTDIKKEAHRIFLQNNISVVSAGETCDKRFGERLLTIMSHFRYAVSNVIGSQVYYTTIMGLPHSIYGLEPVETFQDGVAGWELEYWKKFPGTKIRNNLFKGINTTITAEQWSVVVKDMGLDDGTSRIKMAKILYGEYFCQRHPLLICKDLLRAVFVLPVKKAMPYFLEFFFARACLVKFLHFKHKGNVELLVKSLQRWGLD